MPASELGLQLIVQHELLQVHCSETIRCMQDLSASASMLPATPQLEAGWASAATSAQGSPLQPWQQMVCLLHKLCQGPQAYLCCWQQLFKRAAGQSAPQASALTGRAWQARHLSLLQALAICRCLASRTAPCALQLMLMLSVLAVLSTARMQATPAAHMTLGASPTASSQQDAALQAHSQQASHFGPRKTSPRGRPSSESHHQQQQQQQPTPSQVHAAKLKRMHVTPV